MTYSKESHSSQFQETYSLHIVQQEYGLKLVPHPLHEPLLYIVISNG
jgi:hypothetical protein